MSNKLTKKAQEVLILAEEIAKQYHSGIIGTEHLLLGIFAQGDNVACMLLDNLGLTSEQLEQVIDHEANLSDTFNGFSPRAKKALQLSADEAIAFGINFIGTEHLLLGLAAEGEGVAF